MTLTHATLAVTLPVLVTAVVFLALLLLPPRDCGCAATDTGIGWCQC